MGILNTFKILTTFGTHLYLQENFVNTSKPALSLYDDNCAEYSGICKEHLEMFDTNYSDHSLFTLTLDEISKDNIGMFFDIVNQYSNQLRKQCLDVLMPFLCQYMFPPCDISDGNVHIISKTQCTNIRDALCSVEWTVAMGTSSGAALLPKCEIFNDDNNTIPPKSLQCHYQFKDYCGLCLPLCGKFSLYRVKTKLLEKSMQIFGSATAFVGGILVFITSAYRRKAM